MSLYRIGHSAQGMILAPGGAFSVTLPPLAPAALTAAMWSLTAGDGQATIGINGLPANGGSALTALQYRQDGGAAVTMTGTGTGDRIVTSLTNGTEYDYEVRAVNAVGAGPWSDLKSVTPSAAGPAVILGVVGISPSTAADSGNLAVGTIPGGCNACLVAGVYYSGTSGGPTSITGTFLSTTPVNGALQVSDAGGSMSSYCQAFKVAAAGSDTIRIQRGSTYNEGPAVQIVWLQVADPDDFVRDVDINRRAGGGGGVAEIILTSTATDLVVGWPMGDTVHPMSAPAGTTAEAARTDNNFASLRTFSVDSPGASTTTLTDTGGAGQFWSNIAGFSIK